MRVKVHCQQKKLDFLCSIQLMSIYGRSLAQRRHPAPSHDTKRFEVTQGTHFRLQGNRDGNISLHNVQTY